MQAYNLQPHVSATYTKLLSFANAPPPPHPL
jgi:hypothetical protein